ncbi:hypothetical protein COV24_02805 [candidate division WWE3 bacterium CG10_big_fil_rev_8_21_14_0_10_32_10]|uniref:Uncharacterized protein n=1 Tax=candidate division WWE3 bacterium CG10_big_fil_rev_8_21_14_0_10_32_10 TaxID=1975090 RepID=A0A2H0RAR5_UNCKA|nr:MAG: hypothetical protein COV24_02805 [candidate division WWE3 bacterium CG10_big_fil_rev_8_21_14_0_10_32_10]
MYIYVFGNEDIKEDNKAIIAAKKIKKNFKDINFIIIKPNQDLPFEGDVVIMDTVENINEVRLVDLNNEANVLLSPRITAHDFDLAFQIKYLRKLGKIGNVMLIAIPQNKKVDYLTIQSILRKLVAQDIQGS